MVDKNTIAALSYGAVSLSMNFANKAVFADTTFSSIPSILVIQFLFTIIVLKFMKYFQLVEYNPVSKELLTELALPSLLYCVNVGLSLSSLSSVSIPVYQVIKRITPVATVLIGRIILGKTESYKIHGSIWMILIGTLVMGTGDLYFNLQAYSMGLGSVLSQTLYLLYIQKSGIKHDVLTMLNGTAHISLIIMLFGNLPTGEFHKALSNPEIYTFNLWLHLSIILILGALLNYTLFLCTSINSALSTTVVGCVKAIFGTILGFFTFKGQPVTILLLVGICLNTAGALFYMYFRYKEKLLKQVQSKSNFEYEPVASNDEGNDKIEMNKIKEQL